MTDPGLPLVQGSSDLWVLGGYGAEYSLNTGWLQDYAINSTGGRTTNVSPSTATAFLSTGDGTTGSGNSFYALGRRTRVVHAGGTAYAEVLTAAYSTTTLQTTVTLASWLTGGTTSLSTASITSAAVSPVYAGSGGLGNLPPTDWALISETVLSSTAASIDIQNIPATYSHLMLLIQARTDRVATTDSLILRFNNDSGANYNRVEHSIINSALSGGAAAGGTFIGAGTVPAASATASRAGGVVIHIPNYRRTTFHKVAHWRSAATQDDTAANMGDTFGSGTWRSTAAIDRITISSETASNMIAGTVVSLYGIKGG